MSTIEAGIAAREQYLRQSARLARFLADKPGDYETRGALVILGRAITDEHRLALDELGPVCPYCGDRVPDDERVESFALQGWGDTTCHRDCVHDAEG